MTPVNDKCLVLPWKRCFVKGLLPLFYIFQPKPMEKEARALIMRGNRGKHCPGEENEPAASLPHGIFSKLERIVRSFPPLSGNKTGSQERFPWAGFLYCLDSQPSSLVRAAFCRHTAPVPLVSRHFDKPAPPPEPSASGSGTAGTPWAHSTPRPPFGQPRSGPRPIGSGTRRRSPSPGESSRRGRTGPGHPGRCRARESERGPRGEGKLPVLRPQAAQYAGEDPLNVLAGNPALRVKWILPGLRKEPGGVNGHHGNGAGTFRRHIVKGRRPLLPAAGTAEIHSHFQNRAPRHSGSGKEAVTAGGRNQPGDGHTFNHLPGGGVTSQIHKALQYQRLPAGVGGNGVTVEAGPPDRNGSW